MRLGRGILKRHQVLLTIFEMHWSGHYMAYTVYFTLRLIVVGCALIPDYSGVSLSMYMYLNLCLKCCTPNHIPYVENE